MRSLTEITFRLFQEWGNYRMYLWPPSLPEQEGKWPLALPPREEAARLLRGTPAGERLLVLARRIAGGELPVFDQWIPAGDLDGWRTDFETGRESGLAYFRRIPYLTADVVGDHKRIWEINRHQHLVTLAQAWAIEEKETPYLDTLWRQLESWIEANPFQRGINWTSALEVAFRAFSWCWIWHLAGDRMPDPLRTRFLESLYRHGCHLRINLSIYFSPNTHLLGEALALYTLGALFPYFPGAAQWKSIGGGQLRRQYATQVAADGSHFEQSTYYHVYALDMLLWFHSLEPSTAAGRETAAKMAEFLESLLGGTGAIPIWGDDDGGRWFHPFGARNEFGRSTMAVYAVLAGDSGSRWRTPDNLSQAAVWWLGERATAAASPRQQPAPVSRWFPDAGLGVLRSEEIEIVFDAGPFGPWSGGHSHADTLSFTLRHNGRERLIDPGTFTYVGDRQGRSWFRSAAAHNTVTVKCGDGCGNEVEEAGPFGWRERPAARLVQWESSPMEDRIEGECRYGRVVHRRALLFDKAGQCVWIADWIEGPAALTAVFHQRWHCAADWDRPEITFTTQDSVKVAREDGWRSRVFNSREPAPVLTAAWESAFPARVVSVFRFAGGSAGLLEVQWYGREAVCRLEGMPEVVLKFK